MGISREYFATAGLQQERGFSRETLRSPRALNRVRATAAGMRREEQQHPQAGRHPVAMSPAKRRLARAGHSVRARRSPRAGVAAVRSDGFGGGTRLPWNVAASHRLTDNGYGRHTRRAATRARRRRPPFGATIRWRNASALDATAAPFRPIVGEACRSSATQRAEFVDPPKLLGRPASARPLGPPFAQPREPSRRRGAQLGTQIRSVGTTSVRVDNTPGPCQRALQRRNLRG
jgi:hypothetical protein